MSRAPRVKSMNVEPDSDVRRLLVSRKPERTIKETKEEKKASSHRVPSILRKQDLLFHLSLDASCSSDASSESLNSRASTGRLRRSFSSNSSTRQTTSSSSNGRLRRQCAPRPDKVGPDSDSVLDGDTRKRCAWVTPNTDPSYATFHDEEWGVPVHDDKKLFELLVLSGALAELTWPTILSKRHLFREVFADFDPVAVSNLNEKKITTPGNTASSLLSELKLRAVIDNARQMSKIIQEFGSFDKYIWSFVNHKPIVSRFRYPRQVPVKTPKADVISKDLVRRGFRSVGPTVIYSFMQVAGITNDHVISCFRFQKCLDTVSRNKEENEKAKTEERKFRQVAGITNDHAVDCFRSEECLETATGTIEDEKAVTEEKKTEDIMDIGIAKVMTELNIMDELSIASECRVSLHEKKEQKGLAWQVE